MKKSCAVVCILGCSLWSGWAGLILQDSFDYPDGPLISASGTLWSNYSGTASQIGVVGGRIFLNKTNSEDVHAVLLGAPYMPVAWPVLYSSFTLSVTNLPTGGGDYFATFKAGGTTDQHGRIFIGTSGAATGKYRIAVANGSSPETATLTNDLSTNVNYTVVLRYVVSNSTSTLWLDPSAETDAGVTATDLISPTSVSYFAFREVGPSSSALGNIFVDDLRVGTAFSDVVTNAPQPPPTPSTAGALSLLTYNLNGNGKEDWSTNTAQAQAIGRTLIYLNPDIVTFTEIPYTNTYQMTNWIKAFLPGYYLATNSVTDGFIRSGIACRYPIARSTSWMPHGDLNPFGYTNSNFTRDLFEAEINVPAYAQPLHVFVSHLKSTSTDTNLYQDDANKRAAEAAAISNFFVNVFLPGTNGSHPYVLTGDMNEDVWRPDTAKYISGQPIQRITSAPTGLQLTMPVNPITASELTLSIRLPLDVRFDYILPCGLLYSNILTSEVFRSDVLRPLPAGLLGDDSKTASDHLPVIMYFNNPYGGPFRVLSIARSNPVVTLTWESISNRQYRVDTSSNLTSWTVFASNLTATSNSFTLVTNASGNSGFFRVYRVP